MAALLAAAGMDDDESSSTESEEENKLEEDEIDRQDTKTEKTKEKKSKNIKGRAVKLHLERDTSVPRDVWSWFEITVKEIDVPSQTFTCSIETHLFWIDFALPGIIDVETEEFLLDDESVPFKMTEVWENKLGEGFDKDPEYKYFKDESVIYMSFVMEVTFTERMELNKFPIDRQFLNMEFNGYTGKEHGNWNWLTSCPDWVPDSIDFKGKNIAVRFSSSVTEYELLTPWVDFSKEMPLQIRLRVERLAGYYFGNIILPNFLIVLSALSGFPVPRFDVADRLSVSITLMLAAVAFRFIVATMLPSLSYMTWLDYYILIGFSALTFFIAENSVVGWDGISNDLAKQIDWLTGSIFAVLWILMHIAIYIVLFNGYMRTPWAVMDEEDRQGEDLDGDGEVDDDEWVPADPDHCTGFEQSEHCKEQWARYKLKPPEEWARMYSDDNPTLDIDVPGDKPSAPAEANAMPTVKEEEKNEETKDKEVYVPETIDKDGPPEPMPDRPESPGEDEAAGESENDEDDDDDGDKGDAPGPSEEASTGAVLAGVPPTNSSQEPAASSEKLLVNQGDNYAE